MAELRAGRTFQAKLQAVEATDLLTSARMKNAVRGIDSHPYFEVTDFVPTPTGGSLKELPVCGAAPCN